MVLLTDTYRLFLCLIGCYLLDCASFSIQMGVKKWPEAIFNSVLASSFKVGIDVVDEIQIIAFQRVTSQFI